MSACESDGSRKGCSGKTNPGLATFEREQHFSVCQGMNTVMSLFCKGNISLCLNSKWYVLLLTDCNTHILYSLQYFTVPYVQTRLSASIMIVLSQCFVFICCSDFLSIIVSPFNLQKKKYSYVTLLVLINIMSIIIFWKIYLPP